MDEALDEEIGGWLGQFAIDWAVPLESVPKHLGQREAANRQESYPRIAKAISGRPLDLAELNRAASGCWALGERFDTIRFGEFIKNPRSADAIAGLLDDFPLAEDATAVRISAFIEACGPLGYTDPKSENTNAASSALLASVLLTAIFPKRFVDFRQTRWRGLADELKYRIFRSEKPSYGEMLIDAGTFAKAISETDTFKKWWPTGEPLWTIAGICWVAKSEEGAKRPEAAAIYPYEEDFDEGAMVLRQHLIRERNTTVVRKAKELWLKVDPLLRCDVCGFSFAKRYGNRGEGYIEAHHTKPIHALQPGSRTKVEDLAKVCSNCHRMLHFGDKCLPIDELRAMLS